MPEKATDNNAAGCLVLIVPAAFIIAVLFVAWPFLLALLGLSVGASLWQTYQWQQISKQINPTFNQLIVDNKGCVTPLDLALKANLAGPTAKRFLDSKAKEFGAQQRDYEDRGRVYYFLTVNTLGRLFDESEPPEEEEELPSSPKVLKPQTEDQPSQTESETETEEELDEPATENRIHPQAIIQSELAKRLDVHSSTIYKRRDDPEFSEWTRNRDPEGIAWGYSAEHKEFYPLSEDA